MRQVALSAAFAGLQGIYAHDPAELGSYPTPRSVAYPAARFFGSVILRDALQNLDFFHDARCRGGYELLPRSIARK